MAERDRITGSPTRMVSLEKVAFTAQLSGLFFPKSLAGI
jgi:hypothetical protein